MRVSFIIAFAVVCFAVPAMAQDWTTQSITVQPISGLPGGLVYTENGRRPLATRPLTASCYSNINLILSDGPCTAAQLAQGGHVSFRLALGAPETILSNMPVNAINVDSGVGIAVSGIYRDPAAPGGVSTLEGIIPISAFATAGQNATLSARIDDFMAQQTLLAAEMKENHDHAIRGVALASSLSLLAPADGRSNRLGFGMGTFAGETAMSINYTRRAGDFDLGIAGAITGGDTLGKASFGVSW
jgi:hypothetical protein